MNQKRSVSFLFIAAVSGLIACNSAGNNKFASADSSSSAQSTTTTDNTAASGDVTKGIGSHQSVQLTHPLDDKMIAAGKSTYDVKCQSCHKLTDEKLVGPGWKGVTDRRTPEWIMNFVTNTDEMIEKDPAAQKLLEECLVRMPNQSLSETDARSVLEFMRNNDGKK